MIVARILVVLLFLLAFALVATFVRDVARRRREVWGEAARRLGGTFDPTSGRWLLGTPQITAHLDGVEVVIDLSHDGNDAFTRARSEVAEVGNFTLRIAPKGAWQRAAVALGAQDVETGDPAFDEAWVVRTSDPERARAFLDPAVRAMVSAAGPVDLALKRGELTASLAHGEADADAIVGLAEVTAAIAARGPALRRLWEAVAREARGEVERLGEGRLRIQIDDAVPLRIERTDADVPATVVVARRLEASPEPFAVDEAGALASERPDVTRRRIDPLRRRLEALGPHRIDAGADELTLHVADLEGDADRMREAMDLARRLAAPVPRDPYRG